MVSRRYGRVRCPKCGTRYGLDESHTCLSNAAVMAAAFGGPGRVAGSNDVLCGDYDCGCRTRESRAVA